VTWPQRAVLVLTWLVFVGAVAACMAPRCRPCRWGLFGVTLGAAWLLAGETLGIYGLAPEWLTEAPWRPLVYRASLLLAIGAFWWRGHA
jgi:hypothetical protein